MSDAQKPTSVQEARATLEQEIYDEMSGGLPGRDVRWPDAIDTLIAAATRAERERIRQAVEGMERYEPDEKPEGGPTMCEHLYGEYLDRHAVLAFLDKPEEP